MSKEYGYLVNGKWLKSEREKEIINPFNNEVVGVINVPDIDKAMESIENRHQVAHVNPMINLENRM